jgi:hypothetical protein
MWHQCLLYFTLFRYRLIAFPSVLLTSMPYCRVSKSICSLRFCCVLFPSNGCLRSFTICTRKKFSQGFCHFIPVSPLTVVVVPVAHHFRLWQPLGSLLKVFDDLVMATDRGQLSALCILDFAAAFDTVYNELLLTRWECHFGIQDESLSWFRSYLISRSYCVVCQGMMSRMVKLSCSVL